MEFNFKKYVFSKRAEGLSDKQIATSLGMSLKHFKQMADGVVEKVQEAVIKPIAEKKAEKTPEVPVKPVIDSDVDENGILKEYPKSEK